MRGLILALAALAACAFATAASARGVYNKEGYWEVTRLTEGCGAGLFVEGGSQVLLLVTDGEVTLMAGFAKPARPGRKGVISTEAYSFEFDPHFSDDRKLLTLEGPLNARALGALRLARGLAISVDGRVVVDAKLEGTGFEGALDAAISCSKGERGWWGEGFRSQTAKADAPKGDDGLVFNKAGYWGLQVDDEESTCTAVAAVDDGLHMVLVGFDGDITFGVSSKAPLRKGKRGVFATDAYKFQFEPSYDGDGYLYLDDALSDRGLAALRLARTLTISVDGRTVADMKLEGTGLEDVLDALPACSKGERGWWGAGLQKTSTGGKPGPGASSEKGKGEGGSGSAFFISADGLAVTAAHVVAGCKVLRSPRWGAAKVLAADERADLAVVKTETASGRFAPLRALGPKLGEAVSAGGYPLGGLLGSGLKITTGVVSGLAGPGGDRGLFQISAPIQPGNSGGPVIDGGGALVGVTAAKLDEVKFADATGVFPQNVNFAVPVTILQAFLQENGVAYRTDAPPAPGAGGLTSYTFSLECTR